MGSLIYAGIAGLAAVGGLLYNPLKLRAEVVGFTRPYSSIQNIHGEGLKIIPDTVQCEDLHHHLPSGLLFAACQGKAAGRFSWFPPLANFIDRKAADSSKGSIYVIDPKTFKSKRLSLDGFSDPFITHGIDIYSSPSSPDSIYIYAVNHLPNPTYYTSTPLNASIPKARSQIEVFEHTIGTSTAKHLRSIRHEMIRTPNDIYVTAPTTFYITNDHHYREGHMRFIEDIGYHSVAPWSDIVHITVGSLAQQRGGDEVGVAAKVAYSGMHNPNGIGHGANSSEILIVRAAAGVFVRAMVDPADKSGKKLKILEEIQLPSSLDNPTYYSDPYASAPGAADDASGYVLAGLGRALDLSSTHLKADGLDPVMVWMVRPSREEGKKWDMKLIFQDDSKTIRSASAAVVVGIDPKENGGRKQGWLFVTGFFSKAMVATKIDL